MRILFTGGGTLGSVSPLVAVYQALTSQGYNVECRWLGTADGPEREVVSRLGVAFQPIVAPKLRRYWDWRTLGLPFAFAIGVISARAALKRFAPDVVVSAGSFVAVPVVVAAATLRIPRLIHQQDVVPSLTNRMLAPIASAITVTFAATQGAFPVRKTVVTGNPVRTDITLADRTVAGELFRFDPAVPTVLVLGGGTGAAALNQLVLDSLPELVGFCQVVHLTGRGKMSVVAEHPRYRAFEFLGPEMAAAYAVADVVVSRAGMGALTELAVLGKAVLLVPIPGSHQVHNAMAFVRNNAAVLLEQTGLTAAEFAQKIRATVADLPMRQNLSRNIAKMLPADAAQKVADVVRRLAGVA